MKIIQKSLNRGHLFSLFNMDSLVIGDSLVFDLFIKRENDYVIVIEAGTVLSAELSEKLQKQDKLYIAKEDVAKQILTCETLQSYINHNLNNLEKTLGFLYKVNSDIFTDYINSDENKISIECVESIVKSIIFLTQNNQGYLKNIIPYFDNKYELFIHSLHVCIYAVNLGHALEMDSKKLLQLGIAALIHDLGMKKIDDSIRSKEDQLSLSEYELIYKHPRYSAQIARQNHVTDPLIIDAITHHHENYDGSGYPDCLSADDISDLASILSISDVFNAMTNSRPHRKAYTSFEALKVMMKDNNIANKFNQKYVQIFLRML